MFIHEVSKIIGKLADRERSVTPWCFSVPTKTGAKVRKNEERLFSLE
jgi:hypothetical protein